MTPEEIGRREKITYRVVVTSGPSRSFLPAFGIGSGLDDPALGITLHRLVKGPTEFRTTHRTVVGVVVTEDADHVTIQRDDGRREYLGRRVMVARGRDAQPQAAVGSHGDPVDLADPRTSTQLCS